MGGHPAVSGAVALNRPMRWPADEVDDARGDAGVRGGPAKLSDDAPIATLSPAAAEAYLQLPLGLERHVADAAFLFGDEPSVADFSVYHCCWFLRQNAVVAAHLAPFGAVQTGCSAWPLSVTVM